MVRAGEAKQGSLSESQLTQVLKRDCENAGKNLFGNGRAPVTGGWIAFQLYKLETDERADRTLAQLIFSFRCLRFLIERRYNFERAALLI